MKIVDGLAYWVALLGDNTDTTAIRESFSTSAESIALFGGKTDTTATEGLIIVGLGAQADSAILNGVITFA